MMQAMAQLEQRSDEELEREQRHRAAAQAILGSRAAERFDAKATREHFRKALAAARPQERMGIRRMADASLALAERRAGDLKVAVEKLGQEAPSAGQLRMFRLMGLVAPGGHAPLWKRARGILLMLAIVVLLLVAGFAIVKLVALPFGGIGTTGAVWLGFLVVLVAFGALFLRGRRKQAQAKARRAAGG